VFGVADDVVGVLPVVVATACIGNVRLVKDFDGWVTTVAEAVIALTFGIPLLG